MKASPLPHSIHLLLSSRLFPFFPPPCHLFYPVDLFVCVCVCASYFPGGRLSCVDPHLSQSSCANIYSLADRWIHVHVHTHRNKKEGGSIWGAIKAALFQW